MSDSIKKELHQLVDKCDNELLLEEAKALLESEKDGWDQLSEEDKHLIKESETQYGKGDFIDHRKLMESFHIRIRKKYAAAIIKDLIRSEAVENVEEPVVDLTTAQRLALDKELDAIKNDPSYLKKWNDIKQQFKKS